MNPSLAELYRRDWQRDLAGTIALRAYVAAGEGDAAMLARCEDEMRLYRPERLSDAVRYFHIAWTRCTDQIARMQ